MKFEWDEDKAKTNQQKHHISFHVAARVFSDPHALAVQDRVENGEYRWQTIGLVNGQLIVLVAHTVRLEDDAEIIRIVSARRADPKERKRYEQNRSS